MSVHEPTVVRGYLDHVCPTVTHIERNYGDLGAMTQTQQLLL